MASTTAEFVVLVDFEGHQEDELTLKVGDVVKHVKKGAEDGWLEGEIGGKRGYFPSHFVKEIPASLMGDGNKKYPRSIRKAKAKTQQRWCKAEYSYMPEKADELALTAGDVVEVLQEIEDGWWLGKKGALVGAFPSNFVQECAAPPAAKVVEVTKNNKQRSKVTDATFHANGQDKSTQENTTAKNNNKAPVKEYCKVMFDYVPANKDELALKSGEVILILRKDLEDEGWWEGELNGKTGLFPDNFVMALTPASDLKTDKPPVRKLSVKGPVKTALTVSEKTPADGSNPQAQPLKDQKVKPDVSVPEKKTPESTKPQTPPLKDQKDLKNARMDPANKVLHPPPKKAAPAPPVPLKTKSSFKADKPDGIVQSKPEEVVKESASEPDASHFSDLALSTSKLSHPTADRPKMPGKRPPTHLNHTTENHEEKGTHHEVKVEEGEERQKSKVSLKTKEPEHLAPGPAPSPAKVGAQVLPNAASPAKVSANVIPTAVSPNPSQAKKVAPGKASPEPGAREVKHKSDPELGDRATALELKSEIQSLKVLMETMKRQYERDMVGIKAELNEEKQKRLILQTEVERVKRLLPL